MLHKVLFLSFLLFFYAVLDYFKVLICIIAYPTLLAGHQIWTLPPQIDEDCPRFPEITNTFLSNLSYVLQIL